MSHQRFEQNESDTKKLDMKNDNLNESDDKYESVKNE